jgi:acyl-CoA thioesterase FadM
VTALPTVDCTVYPCECDAFGHLNEAFLAVLERARWESLARGPGMDVFRRSGVWPAVRKATIEYRAAAYPGDVLRVETLVTHRGTTSFTLKQVATRVRDTALISEAEVRGEGLPVLFVHGFPFDRSMWKHQLATLARSAGAAAVAERLLPTLLAPATHAVGGALGATGAAARHEPPAGGLPGRARLTYRSPGGAGSVRACPPPVLRSSPTTSSRSARDSSATSTPTVCSGG